MENTEKLDALVTAGGRIDGEFAAAVGVELKALIELGGRTVLDRVLTALRDSGRVERIVVVGPAELEKGADFSGVERLEDAGSLAENFLAGMRHWRDSEFVLCCTSDLPFITGQAICDFLDRCPPEADLCYGVVTERDLRAAFPESRSMLIPLGGERVTGTGVFRFRPAAVLANEGAIHRVTEARKNRWAMVRLLGWGFLLRLKFNRLTIPVIERRVSQILGCPCQAILGVAPAFAFDLDKLVDWEAARRYLLGDQVTG